MAVEAGGEHEVKERTMTVDCRSDGPGTSTEFFSIFNRLKK